MRSSRRTLADSITDASWFSPRLVHSLAASLVVVVIQFLHGPAIAFVYDSVQYWDAPNALLTGENAADAGVLQIRGVLSAVVYLPPAFATSIIGPESAGWTVLTWNALLAAVICVVILVRLAELLSPGWQPARVWASALVGGVILSGYARYPHLDVWSLAFALAGILALAAGRRWWHAVLGAAAMVIAINLRPSYIAPLVLAAAVLLVARPRVILPATAGGGAALVPQVLFNLTVMGQFSLSPVATPFLLRVQAAQATYAIRYDTVAFTDRHPQQWYCDPAYANLLTGDPEPGGPLDVVASVVRHLPDSLWFLTQKAAASLQWSFATPMENAPTNSPSLMSFFIVGVSATGLVALIAKLSTAWRVRTSRVVGIALVGFWFATLATIVLSTPETRFALPVALIGLIGLLAVIPTSREAFRHGKGWAVASIIALALAGAVFLAGRAGLAHPMPAGPLPDAAACSASYDPGH